MSSFRRFFLWPLGALILFNTASFAQDVPIPRPHPAIEIEQQRKESEARQKDLEGKMKKLESELGTTQSSLVEIAAQIKKNESALSTLEVRIAANKIERTQIEARLKEQRGSIGTLISALERLNRTPPEAVIARPGAPLRTAQSAMLLQSILPDIYKRAEKLRADLDRLNVILAELQQDETEVKTARATLDARQTDMAALLQKRKSLYARTQTDVKEETRQLAEISARAQNLKDLVARVEAKERQAREQARIEEEVRTAARKKSGRPAPSEEIATATPKAYRPTPIPRAGAAQLPIAGVIRIGYAQTDDIGARSQGLTIDGRKGAIVVAPMGGVVRYAGYFKNYGQIVIVEHEKDYHSLIAGLARIDTVVGQSVAAGEPIGLLGASSGEGKPPSLYYELRQEGQPVDPARRFGGLG